MKTAKKLLSLLCAVALLASCFSLSVPAAYAEGEPVNIALTATASDNLNGVHYKEALTPDKVNDGIKGDDNSRWSPAKTESGVDTVDWQLYLKWDSEQIMDCIKIQWSYSVYAKDFSIKAKDGNGQWVTLKTIVDCPNPGGNTAWQSIYFDRTVTTEIGIFFTKISDKGETFRIFEVEVYDSQSTNLALRATADDNVDEYYKGSPEKINDGIIGDDNSRWSPKAVSGTDTVDWQLYLKWDSEQTLNCVKIQWSSSVYAKNFSIKVKNENDEWVEVKKVTNNPNPGGSRSWQTLYFDHCTTTELGIFFTKVSASGDTIRLFEVEVYDVEINNLALSATAHDNINGSNQGGDGPQKINDGIYDYNGRWASEQTSGNALFGDWRVWLEWDEAQTFNQLDIYWEDNRGKAYTIAVSDDGENWTVVKAGGAASSGLQTVFIGPVTTKYVGVFITEKKNDYGVSIFELEVYNNPSSNLALYATAYDNQNGSNQNSDKPYKINDKKEDSRWTSRQDTFDTLAEGWNVWLAWSEAQTFNTIKIYWEDCHGKAYTIRTSDDGENWTVIYTGGAANKGWETLEFAETTAKYVGVFITQKSNSSYGVAIWELEVYNVYRANSLYGGSLYYDSTNLSSYCGDLNVRTLTDGAWVSNANNYQPPENNSHNATVYIKPYTAIDMNKLLVYAESEGYDFDVFYTTADVSSVGDMDGFAALEWNLLLNSGDSSKRRYSFRIVDGTYVYSFGFERVTGVTAISIVYNGYSWYKLREVEAFDDSTDVSGYTPPDAKIYLKSGDTSRALAVSSISYDAVVAGKIITAHYTVTKIDGTKTSGSINVTKACARLKLGDTIITSGDVSGCHNGDYMVAVYFKGVPAGAKLEVSFTSRNAG